MAVDAKQLRSVFGKFATGVTVVTFERDGEVYGMTVNSFSSVSLEPPMVLFCPALNCRFAQNAELGSHFTISILAHNQKDICFHFAGRPSLESSPWADEARVPPVVEGSIAYLRCELEALHPHGDHFVAVGKVHSWEITSHEAPLMFFSGGYPNLV
ncbi:MAG: flavin reductase family protein [Vulcanimicrobiota bacterium]